MPAPFAQHLCSYRAKNDKPNTSDASDALSVELGEVLFDILEVPHTAATSEDEPTGLIFARQVAADLAARMALENDSIDVIPEKRLNAFEQYRHVGVIREITPGRSKAFDRAWKKLTTHARRTAKDSSLERVESLISSVESVVDGEAERLRALLEELGDESLLGLDVTVSRPSPAARLPLLEVGLSLKWSLRTDRAQDCRSQGTKMSALRRGRMPHFAAVTMEPRPYMLNLLGGGSGDVDCVYHLHLPALTAAVEEVYSRTRQRKMGLDTFHRLVDQRRIRDYDELVSTVVSL